MTTPEHEQLALALEEVVGFLVTGARGLLDEPADYGPMRLLDAAERLVDALEEQGLTTPDTAAIRDGIAAALDSWGASSEEFTASLDALILRLVDSPHSTGGTGTRANIGRPQAGKTGTSEHNRDVWFVEDRLKTLQAVTQEADLADVGLYLALWGYVMPTDRDKVATDPRIVPISLDQFCGDFSAWKK